MSNLTDFLVARIAEEEEAVRRLLAYSHEAYTHGLAPEHWEITRQGEDGWDLDAVGPPHLKRKTLLPMRAWAVFARPFFEHFARYDPARVLADCAAKRQMVRACTYWLTEDSPDARSLASAVLTSMVSGHQGHPDFDPVWFETV